MTAPRRPVGGPHAAAAGVGCTSDRRVYVNFASTALHAARMGPRMHAVSRIIPAVLPRAEEGLFMLVCSICADPYPWHRACDQSHAGLCHSCAVLNFGSTPTDNPPHPAPMETVPHLTAYARRVLQQVPEVRHVWLEGDDRG